MLTTYENSILEYLIKINGFFPYKKSSQTSSTVTYDIISSDLGINYSDVSKACDKLESQGYILKLGWPLKIFITKKAIHKKLTNAFERNKIQKNCYYVHC